MPLIIQKSVSKQSDRSFVPKGASLFYVTVSSIYLSEPYELQDDIVLLGTVQQLRQESKEFEHLKGKMLSFILKKAHDSDYLHISKEDWNTGFRDWGLILPDYSLKIRLLDYIKNNLRTPLYPNKELEAHE
ncbi:MAG: hypothetical protein ACETV1_07135 [Candidatus Bathyarchaeia archaeon]